jgi:hypothetical protein
VPSPTASSGRSEAAQRLGEVRVSGVARDVQYRQIDRRNQEVLTFRVDAYDRLGNRLEPVAVELRGFQVSGRVSEGEQVEVVGVWDRGTLQATGVLDRTTGAEVRADSVLGAIRHSRSRAVPIALVVVSAVVLLIVAVLLVGRSDSGGGKRAVPNVVGLEVFSARQRLIEAGFDLAHQDVRGSEFCRVLRQDPAAGTPAAKKDDVRVTLFSGPSAQNPPGCR